MLVLINHIKNSILCLTLHLSICGFKFFTNISFLHIGHLSFAICCGIVFLTLFRQLTPDINKLNSYFISDNVKLSYLYLLFNCNRF